MVPSQYAAPDLVADPTGEVHDIMAEQEGGRPEAEGDPEALTFDEFNRYVEEIQWQPDWRTEADKSADYYDGNQFDQDTLAELERRGIMPIIKNLIQPTIDVVLGMEAKTRADFRVSADTEEFQDVAEALSQRLHEVERESKADRACSDAYAGMVKTGVHWVEVGRPIDPMEYPYECNEIHRREMYWDWPQRKYDMSDARYLIRRRWFDLDQTKAYFPDAADVLNQVGNGWPADWWLRRGIEDAGYGFALDQEIRTSLEEWEWRNVVERRIVLFETWYRRFVRGYVLTLPNGRTVEFDNNNPLHITLVGRGMVKPRPAVYSKLRQSIWAGPHRIRDRATQRRRLPYIPFFGYREDLTGIPYGLIRSMISPQDEVNARAQKMLWYLSARRAVVDSDALAKEYNTFSEVLDEMARADAVIVLDPDRRNPEGFRVDDNMQLADGQFKVMLENMETLQKVRGIFNAMIGRSDDNAESGVALNALIEQSTTVLAEINDNYQRSRALVGEALLDLIREDIGGQPVEVFVDGVGAKRKTVVLNNPVQDPNTGMMYLENDVQKSDVKVGLYDVPSSPSYRMQQSSSMAEIIKRLPPELAALLTPYWLESTEHPKRFEMAEDVRKHLGIVDMENLPPEQQQMMLEEQQFQQELQRRGAMADVAEREAKSAKLAAEAQMVQVEMQNLGREQQDKFQGQIDQIKQQTQTDIDRLTAEKLKERQAAQQKENVLNLQLLEAQNQASANRDNASAEIRKAEIDKEREALRAEADKEIARIGIEQNEVMDNMTAQLDSLKAEIISRVDGVESKVTEIESRQQELDLGEGEPAEPPVFNITVPVTVEGKEQTSKTSTLKGPDGKTYTMTTETKGE